MKFNETLLYSVLSWVNGEIDRLNPYSLILKIPVLLIYLIVGIILAVIIDFFVAAGMDKP